MHKGPVQAGGTAVQLMPELLAECDEVTAEMWEEKIKQLNLWSEQ